VASFALDDTRDRFAGEIQTYFADWTRLLAEALKRSGLDMKTDRETAKDIVAGIQGALVLARSHYDPGIFIRAIGRSQRRIEFER
jgi:TetR/AcrR family transcriptional regulator, lmrAB and yxaGH operons repressor